MWACGSARSFPRPVGGGEQSEWRLPGLSSIPGCCSAMKQPGPGRCHGKLVLQLWLISAKHGSTVIIVIIIRDFWRYGCRVCA